MATQASNEDVQLPVSEWELPPIVQEVQQSVQTNVKFDENGFEVTDG